MLQAVDLAYPFEGRWLTQNSPADRVPSHGTTVFATAFAIDFVPANEAGRTAPITLRSLFRPEPVERFPGFGRTILAPVGGVVVGVHGAAPDHQAVRGLPSVGYALTQRRRALAGWPELAGNHVMIETRDGPVVRCATCNAAASRCSSGNAFGWARLWGVAATQGTALNRMSTFRPSTART